MAEMTFEDCKKLMSLPVYQDLIQGFFRRRPFDSEVERALSETFIARIRVEKPSYFEDYESQSLVINDFLQPIFWDLLGLELSKYFNCTKAEAEPLLRRGVLEYQYIQNRGGNGVACLMEEMANLFSAWMVFNHRNWVLRLEPFSMHQGALGDWKKEIASFIKEFHRSGVNT